MKKRRYKFDSAWRDAMVSADVDNPGRIERMIRAYIEDDIEPESTFAIERTFRGAWTVIKAQIKARKERNRRAAERRRQRRQEALAAKAAAEAAQAAAQPDKSIQSDAEAVAPTLQASQPAGNAAQPSKGRTASTTTASAPKNRVPTAPESLNGPSTASQPAKKQKFSDRFRGPGMKASPHT